MDQLNYITLCQTHTQHTVKDKHIRFQTECSAVVSIYDDETKKKPECNVV